MQAWNLETVEMLDFRCHIPIGAHPFLIVERL